MKDNFFEQRGIYYKTNDFQVGRPTVLFVHGLSASSSAWLSYEKYFQDKCNIVSFDLRGHGKSVKMQKYNDYKMEYLADDISELVKYLNLPKFIIISHSFGTLVALEYIKKHQNTLAGTVFLSPSSDVNSGILSKILKPFLVVTRIFDFLPVFVKTAGHIDYARFAGTGDWNIRRLSTDIHNTSLRVYLFCTRQSYSQKDKEILDQIYIPTLIIHGKKDTIFPVENAILMNEKIKDSEMILIDNTNHIIVLNNFDELSLALENFIDRVYKLW